MPTTWEYRRFLAIVTRVWLWVCCALWSVADGQEAGPKKPDLPSPAKSANLGRAEILEDRPSVFIFKDDKTGEDRLVPGWTLQKLTELEQIWLQTQKAEQPPAFVLNRLSLQGAIENQHADLAAQCDVVTNSDNWVRVPLRLHPAVLNSGKSVQYQGPGQYQLVFEAKTNDYVLWLKGKPQQPHQITLPLLAPARAVGGQWQLKLTLPRATTSELRLTVPTALDRKPEVNTGEVAFKPAGNQRTEIHVRGVSSDFTLSWSEPNQTAFRRPVSVTVTGSLLARVDGRSVNTQARFAIRSPGGGLFASFRMRLPPGAARVPHDVVGYQIVEEPPPANQPAARRVVKFVFDEPSASQVVQLHTERIHDVAKANDLVELLSYEAFDVTDAQGAMSTPSRQSGHLAVQVSENWQVSVVERRFVAATSVSELPADLRAERVREAHEYLTQPAALSVRIRPKETRVAVEPECVLEVRAERVEMALRLVYTLRGAPASNLDIDLTGWKVDPNSLSPEALLDLDQIDMEKVSPLSLRFLQPATGRVEIAFRAAREIPPQAEKLSVSLPRPLNALVGPGKVAVLAADNVELTPSPQAMAGMTRPDAAPKMTLPTSYAQQALYYRADLARATFAAGFQVRPGQVTVDAQTEAFVAMSAAKVQQTFQYEIAFEPLTHVWFDVPPSLAVGDRVQFYLGNERLKAIVPRSDEEQAGRVRMQVALRTEQIGSLRVRAVYELGWDKPDAESSATHALPLVTPSDGRLLRNRLDVTAEPGVRLAWIDRGHWVRRAGESDPPSDETLRYDSDELPHECLVAVTPREVVSFPHATQVERVFVQTILSGTARQERAVYRIATAERTLDWQLPEGAEREDEILVDGQPAEATPTAQGVQVQLDGESGLRTYVIELRYHFVDRPVRGRHFALKPARLPRAAWTREVYWQLAVPADEHLVQPSDRYDAKYAWRRQGIFWRRIPLARQSQLETWCGAERREDRSAGMNVYLFGSQGELPPLDGLSAKRSWIVLLASLPVLLGMLVWLYRPGIRIPQVLLLVGAALVGAAMVWPEPLLVFVQAASVGFGLALMALLLDRLVSRRRPGFAVRGAAPVTADRGSTELPPRGLVVGASTGPLKLGGAEMLIDPSPTRSSTPEMEQ